MQERATPSPTSTFSSAPASLQPWSLTGYSCLLEEVTGMEKNASFPSTVSEEAAAHLIFGICSGLMSVGSNSEVKELRDVRLCPPSLFPWHTC